MPHIQQLSTHVADLIAAGEVVERPASVVKELMENAIDAGATQIVVEIQGGGMASIRVADNGCGIAPEELPTAFLRHATSKLRTAADLGAIGTLGFRGEALAAIAAVSRVDVFTRTAGREEGARLSLEGGVPGPVESAGCPEGTTIVVRDLFYNTPARMKFMKKDTAEAAAVAGVVQHLSLSNPHISFRFLKDGGEVLHTPGDSQLSSAIYSVLGREFAMGLIPVEGSGDGVGVSGFVTRPVNGRGTRGMQTFFVNGRLVKSTLLTAALEEAYKNQLMKGRFPGCVLHLTIPKDQVDVNVHPAKTVVKFARERQVFSAVYHVVQDTLDRSGGPVAPEVREEPAARSVQPRQDFYQRMDAAQFRSQQERKSQPQGTGGPVRPADEGQARPPARAAGGWGKPLVLSDAAPRRPADWAVAAVLKGEESAPARRAEAPLSQEMPEAPARQAEAPLPEGPEAAEERPPEPQPREEPGQEPEQLNLVGEERPRWRMAGEVLRTYIVADDGENLWLIDKHAAHERINFDRMKAGAEPIVSQELLAAEAVQLSAEDSAALLEQLPLLEEFGFAAEDFGGGSLLIRAIPADIDAGQIRDTLEMLAGQLRTAGTADPSKARDAMLHTMACKAAIKGGWVSDPAELQVLVDRVASGEVRYCPHGRPVAVKLSRYELERMFKRA